jgi:hypothetical protein
MNLRGVGLIFFRKTPGGNNGLSILPAVFNLSSVLENEISTLPFSAKTTYLG